MIRSVTPINRRGREPSSPDGQGRFARSRSRSQQRLRRSRSTSVPRRRWSLGNRATGAANTESVDRIMIDPSQHRQRQQQDETVVVETIEIVPAASPRLHTKSPRKSIKRAIQNHFRRSFSPDDILGPGDASMSILTGVEAGWLPPNTLNKKKKKKNQKKLSAMIKNAALYQFLTISCPEEVLGKIFACCGPQTVSAFAQTNQQWHSFCNKETTWRIMCEELYKWKQDDPIPPSWKEHYVLNPCVPVDFKSIQMAIAMTAGGDQAWYRKTVAVNSSGRNSLTKNLKSLRRLGVNTVPINNNSTHTLSSHGNVVLVESNNTTNNSNVSYSKRKLIAALDTAAERVQAHRNVTVWLRPGTLYEVDQAITIKAMDPATQITIKTMELPVQKRHHIKKVKTRKGAHSSSSGDHRRSSRRSRGGSPPEQPFFETATLDHSDPHFCSDGPKDGTGRPKMHPSIRQRAVLFSNTRRKNEPLIHVIRGELILHNVALQHHTTGVDIWNGNAALQVQPSDSDGVQLLQPNTPMVPPLAKAVLNRVEIASSSGRGVVVVGGGHLQMVDCLVRDCAATGVYVGCALSRATLERTDILFNGVGNQRAGGIPRGHSGVYMERGQVILKDCSVSQNTASGISVVASAAHGDGTTLHMEHTDVLSNGSAPMDFPRGGGEEFMFLDELAVGQQMLGVNAAMHHHNSNRNNHNRISVVGYPKARSSILQEHEQRYN